jgi:hypothetical protein
VGIGTDAQQQDIEGRNLFLPVASFGPGSFAQLLSVGIGGVEGCVVLVGGAEGVDPRLIYLDQIQQCLPRLQFVAVRAVPGHETFIAPPEVHPAPVHVRAGRLGRDRLEGIDAQGAAREDNGGFTAFALSDRQPANQPARCSSCKNFRIGMDVENWFSVHCGVHSLDSCGADPR